MTILEILTDNTVAFWTGEELLCLECRGKSLVLYAHRVCEDDMNRIAIERGHGRCDRCQQEIGSVPHARHAQV